MRNPFKEGCMHFTKNPYKRVIHAVQWQILDSVFCTDLNQHARLSLIVGCQKIVGCLVRNGGMDPYSSPYGMPNNVSIIHSPIPC